MKQMMQIYRENREAVEGFLLTTISDNPHQDFNDVQVKNFFKRLPCLSDMYLMNASGQGNKSPRRGVELAMMIL